MAVPLENKGLEGVRHTQGWRGNLGEEVTRKTNIEKH